MIIIGRRAIGSNTTGVIGKVTEPEVRDLHGIGRNALDQRSAARPVVRRG